LNDERPVAMVYLRGRLRFDASDLRVNDLENMCRQILDPVALQVREDFEGRDFVDESAGEEDQPLDRGALERVILQARFAQDERYAPIARTLAGIATDLKERSLRDDSGATMLAAMRSARASHPVDRNDRSTVASEIQP
jgi:hypothetical protein